ncbi:MULTISPECIES: phosphatase PAP2 family protein [unclassified Leptolyngbya]|uniref:phosphatase PAP2 family protein n=1 Tax=unclassified Leptolyngbya TaxID=2650499 RepID=UPI001689C8C3|nr:MULTISPECIES: phosphatase PAP2 family protein [unclassified Leptolyngbya]MBD1913658.1 phosphatase PAP2 family protein [Leptolyngbya sp. FACHB-8]MBD2158256.1 phosphatase PAP2 family protein [Leptolyngbya sp. FACHB-16]
MIEAKLKRHLRSFWAVSKTWVISHRASLLLLLVGVFLPLQVFGELAEDVWENEGGFSWDVPILLAIHARANPQLDAVVTILTRFGVFWGVFPAAIIISIFLLLRRRLHRLTYFLITLLGATVLNRVAKAMLHRVRPQLWTSPAPELDYGFPSGHAMASMTLVVALIVLTWGSYWCWVVALAGGAFVLMIGWTRLYLGVHYPSDILAGWAASIAWAIGVKMLIRFPSPPKIQN